jgi:hypothetical protein
MYREPLIVVMLAAWLSACAGSTPAPSRGGDEVTCPDGSANPNQTIRTVNCSTLVQYDGDALEANVAAKELVSAGIKNADVVLREVSQAATDAQLQFTQVCELYNACNLTSQDYARRLDEAQSHFRALREKVELLQAAKGNPEVLRRTVTELYTASVPVERRSEARLGMQLTVQARPRDGGDVRVVRDQETLQTGDALVFGIRVSHPAHVYLFQRKAASGALEVLFPSPAISAMNNPLPASQLTRLPPKGQVFTLDDKDLGEETVYIAVSRQPLADLGSALSEVQRGDPQGSQRLEQAMDSLFDEAAPECADGTRGLQVSSESGCGSLSRGLTPTKTAEDPFFTEASSVEAQTLPGDDVILQSFRFQHVN